MFTYLFYYLNLNGFSNIFIDNQKDNDFLLKSSEIQLLKKDCISEIKAKKNDVAELKQKFLAEKDPTKKEDIKYILETARSELLMLDQKDNRLLAIIAHDKFRTSSVHSSITEGFELNCRQKLQKCMYQLFDIGIQNPEYYFEYSRKLTDQKVIDVVMDHYKYHSVEINIYIYANPTKRWHVNQMPEEYINDLWPFTKKQLAMPNWDRSISSLNKVAAYPHPISPLSSTADIAAESAQFTLRAVATMYCIFEASHSNSNLEKKLNQLEVQIAYVIIRFHMRNAPDFVVPDNFDDWISAEVLKLVAFAGVAFVSKPTGDYLSTASKSVNNITYKLPALKSLYKNGRLLYLHGSTHSSRLVEVESKMEDISNEVKDISNE